MEFAGDLLRTAWAGSPGLLPLIFLAIWPSVWPQQEDVQDDLRIVRAKPPAWAKVLFLLTNVPYFVLTIWTASQPPVAVHPWLPAPVQLVCRMSALYAAISMAVGTSSLLLHGAALQMLDGEGCRCGCKCCGSGGSGGGGRKSRAARLARSEMDPFGRGDFVLHQRAWQMRWKALDFSCVLSTVVLPGFCQGSSLPLRALLPCTPLFFAGQRAKAKGAAMPYMAWHGAWHVATAGAAYVALRLQQGSLHMTLPLYALAGLPAALVKLAGADMSGY